MQPIPFRLQVCGPRALEPSAQAKEKNWCSGPVALHQIAACWASPYFSLSISFYIFLYLSSFFLLFVMLTEQNKRAEPVFEAPRSWSHAARWGAAAEGMVGCWVWEPGSWRIFYSTVLNHLLILLMDAGDEFWNLQHIFVGKCQSHVDKQWLSTWGVPPEKLFSQKVRLKFIAQPSSKTFQETSWQLWACSVLEGIAMLTLQIEIIPYAAK